MVELQTPKYVWMDGNLRPWSDAVVHVDSETVKRGLSIFEGVKGYWGGDGVFRFVQLESHYKRLKQSAQLIHLPFDVSFEEFQNAIFELVGAMIRPNKDMWIRPTLYGLEGHWGRGTVSNLVYTAFQEDQVGEPKPIDIGVSTWKRGADLSQPARIKASPNYQVSRLARIEGHRAGYDDMILLNQEGRVAEATGSCVLIVRDGVVSTPSPTEGALESITVSIIEKIADIQGVPFRRRPVDRTELMIADEMALCGTLAEILPVGAIAGNNVPYPTQLLKAIRETYLDIVRGKTVVEEVKLTALPNSFIPASSMTPTS
jgi:branched-chain amino acid aminotransferase